MEHATLVPSHSRGPEQDGMSYRAGFSGTPVAIITPTRSGAVAAPACVRFLTPSFTRVRAHSTGGPCDSGFLSRTCFCGASCSRSRSTGIPGSLTSACSDSPFPRVHPSTHISHILESCRMRRLLALSVEIHTTLAMDCNSTRTRMKVRGVIIQLSDTNIDPKRWVAIERDSEVIMARA